MHPFAHARKGHDHGKAHKIAGYKHGGAIHADAAQDRKLIHSMLKHERHEGESGVHGVKSKLRLDKRARGGRLKHHHTTVNVNLPQRIPPTDVPPLTGLSSRIVPGAGMVGTANPVPGPATMRPIPPTAGMKRGGRVKVETGTPLPGGAKGPDKEPQGYKYTPKRPPVPRKFGGGIPHLGENKRLTHEAHRKGHNKLGYASGGRIHAYPKMEAGADSGEGRLEKLAKYGRKARS
jgi:hypothetical protein